MGVITFDMLKVSVPFSCKELFSNVQSRTHVHSTQLFVLMSISHSSECIVTGVSRFPLTITATLDAVSRSRIPS